MSIDVTSVAVLDVATQKPGEEPFTEFDLIIGPDMQYRLDRKG